MDGTIFSVSEFVSVFNQTLEYAYPSVVVQGEVSELRISKNRWVYFNLKDDQSSVKCFGTVYQLTVPIEDGTMVRVRAMPRLHQQFGFSMNVNAIQPVGEGSIKKSFDLLMAKLEKEGLFAETRKRPLPVLPRHIGLISSTEAAGYQDFLKILHTRWPAIDVTVANVQVQGLDAPAQITRAIDYLSELPVEMVVIVRGGGSIDDLAAFNDESLVRAVVRSKHPILTGIGHERDISLADLAADMRASTPSNAAEIIVPDYREKIRDVHQNIIAINKAMSTLVIQFNREVNYKIADISATVRALVDAQQQIFEGRVALLEQLNPRRVLMRGYAILRDREGKSIGADRALSVGESISIERKRDIITAEITNVKESE